MQPMPENPDDNDLDEVDELVDDGEFLPRADEGDKTANVKRMIARLSPREEWVDAGQGWQAREGVVRLVGWSRRRRVISRRMRSIRPALGRRATGGLASSTMDDCGQQRLCFADIGPGAELYEYQVLATTLEAPIESFGQLYRDRGDDETIFDELKNQWRRGGSPRTIWRVAA